MCGICGCGHPEPHAKQGALPHPPERVHAHRHERRRLEVERSLLERNEQEATALRARLARAGIEAIGLLGGPGSGKTALLEATLARLGEAATREAVVEGDCASDRDARRVAARGARVVQVETGGLCHLDAHLVDHAVDALDLDGVARLWIENVGNLVCPAAFSCGESRRALLVSVTEGDDKPEKYPAMIAAADLLVVSKLDLLPHVEFDVERCLEAARRVKPGLPALRLSARSGAGMEDWLAWVARRGA